jgi:hypothetical protein
VLPFNIGELPLADIIGYSTGLSFPAFGAQTIHVKIHQNVYKNAVSWFYSYVVHT